MFIFWELVGVSSYLLIGFWYERPAAADAAKKAFLTNRLGDFGFLAGIIMIWAAAARSNFGSLEDDFIHQSRPVVGTTWRPVDFLRGGRQIRAIPPACLAAGRDGRPDAGQRPDPCRHDGGRRRLYGLPHFLRVRSRRRRR